MVKYLLAIVGFWLLVVPARSQSDEQFRVVRVVGTVESTSLQRALKTEDIIPSEDKLKFQSRKDYIIVFHPKQGRKRIMGVPDTKSRELNLLLQSFVKPDEKSTGTRGQDHAYIETLSSDLQDSVLILGSGVVNLDPTHLSLEKPHSIKAQYLTKDKKPVLLTVSVGQSIKLDRKTLFPEGQVPTSKILLMYFLVESETQLEAENFLGNFSPLYVDDLSILPEIRSICESLKGRATKDVEKEVTNYLTQEYKKPIAIQLRDWLKAHHLVSNP